MTERAKELDNRREGDRAACPICRKPRRDVIRMDALWDWSLKNPGKRPLRG